MFAIYRNITENCELCSLYFLCIFLFAIDISYVQEIQYIDLNFETKVYILLDLNYNTSLLYGLSAI